jgi:hypothetical protein
MIPKNDTPSPPASLPQSEKDETKTTNFTMQNLQSRLNQLHQLLAEPQKIHIHGFEFLCLKSLSHDIKQRVDTLFFEAHIPSKWKQNIEWNYPSPTKIDVHITLLNYIVKERIKELLLDYLNNNYTNIIYVD